MTAFSVVPSRSGAVRTFEQRTALEMFAARITAVSLSGYLFFGRCACFFLPVSTAALQPQSSRVFAARLPAIAALRVLRVTPSKGS